MRQTRSGFFCLVLAVSALAVALSLVPSWAAAVGLDFWNLPATFDRMDGEAQRGEEFDEENRAMLSRLAAKRQVVEEAAAGRLTLLEAVARFRELDATTPERQIRAWRTAIAANSDEERYCLTVIQHVWALLQERPGASRDVLGELKAQLEEHRRRGDLYFPPDPLRVLRREGASSPAIGPNRTN